MTASEGHAKPLRLRFVSAEYPPRSPGGVGQFTRDLAEGLVAAGHEVHVITAGDDQQIAGGTGPIMHPVAPISRFGLPKTRGGEIVSRATAVWHEVRRIERDGRFDLISAPLWECEGLVCLLDPGLPTVTSLMTTYRTVVDLSPATVVDVDRDEVLALERMTVAHTRAVHALSHAILDRVKADYELRAIENILPPAVPDRFGPKIGAKSPSPIVEVLFVGRLEHRKGVDVLLEAVAQIAPVFPNLRLTLAGRDSSVTRSGETYRAAFARRARRQPELQRAVRFLGAVSDSQLDDLYRNCDFVCAPSRYESFGLVLAEAMSAGKPVVAAAAGGMTEVVRDGIDGMLTQPGDASGLAKSLSTLASRPDLRSRMGRNARARYEQEFATSIVAQRTATVYRQISRRLGDVAHDDPIEQRVADVLITAGLASTSSAMPLARHLLDPAYHPIDPLALLEGVWDVGTEKFVETVVSMLDLDVTSDARRAPLASLRRSGSRRQFIADAAARCTSDQGCPVWLSRLGELPDDRASRRYGRRLAYVARRIARHLALSLRYRTSMVAREVSAANRRVRDLVGHRSVRDR